MSDTKERINKMLKKSEVILNAGKQKPMTNEEWFCQLPTEEKAEVILKKTTELRLERKWSEKYIAEWLKEVHKDEMQGV
jgi:hypothetical protein